MKKNNFLSKKALAAVTAAVVGLSAAPYSVMAATSYQEIASANIAALATEIGEAYGLYLTQLGSVSDMNAGASYTITQGEDLQSLVDAFLGEGMDLSWLESIEITQNQTITDNMFAVFDLAVNGTKICTLNYFMDMASQTFYLSIPELNDGYLMMSAEAYDDMDVSMDMSFNEITDLLADAETYLPSAESIENLINKYGNIVISNAADQESYATTITAEGISQDVTALEGRITEGALYEVGQQFIDAAREDEDLKEVLDKLTTLSGEDVSLYDSFMETLTDLEEELNTDDSETSDGNYLSEILYVDDADQVVGRTFSVYSDNEEEAAINILTPTDGTQEGLDFSIMQEGYEILSVSGLGIESENGVTGTYTVSMDGVDYLYIDLVDVTEDLEAQTSSGIITISFGDALAEDEDAALIAPLVLTMGVTSEGESSTIDMNFNYGGSDIINISMSAAPSETALEMPTVESLGTIYDLENDTDMQTYTSTLNVAGLIASLTEAGAGDLINSLIGGAMS